MSPASLRGRRRTGVRSRTNSLPQTSFAFLVLVGLLAIWFSTGGSSSAARSDFSLDNSLFDVSTVRQESDPETAEVEDSYGSLCSKEGSVFSSKYSLFFLIPGIIVAFIGIALVTDEYFVAALERICERLNLTEDVAGATFMAAGSSAPEFFTSMLGVFVTEDEVGVGTIVGSAVFNILIIIGLSAALAGSVLKLDWRPLARDAFFYIVSIVLLLVFVIGSTKGRVDWWEGLILVGAYACYVLFMAFGNKPYMRWAGNFRMRKREESDSDLESGMRSAGPLEQPAGGEQSVNADVPGNWSRNVTPNASTEKVLYSKLNPRAKFRAAQLAIIATHRLQTSSSENEGEEEGKTFLGIETPSSIIGRVAFPITFLWKIAFKITIVDCSTENNAKYWWITFITSILWISGISYIMVEAARMSGCLLSIPATAMGMTVLAAGTSIPDALASVAVARNGAADMAVSNAIGSNVFDILLGLGFPWFLGALIKEPTRIPVEPVGVVVVPVLILFAIIVALLVLLILMHWELSKRLGFTLFALYAVFVAYVLLDVFVFKFSLP